MRFLRAFGRLFLGIVITSIGGWIGMMGLSFAHVTDTILRELVLAIAATGALFVDGSIVGRGGGPRTRVHAPEAEAWDGRLPGLGLGRGRGKVPALRDATIGAGVGAAMITAVIAVLAASGHYRVTAVQPDALALGRSLVLMVVVAWFEEVLFRGLVFRILEDGAGSMVALVVSAALFGGIHATNAHATFTAVAAIAIEAGVLLGAAYMFARNLWLPIGLHFAWNFFEGPVFGTAVSGTGGRSLVAATVTGPSWLGGGDFGPEAGIVAVVAGVVTAALFLRRARFVPLRQPT